MQLQDIRTEVLETAGLASDDARFPDATLNRIINRALRQISTEADWPWNQIKTQQATTANQETTSVPTGWYKTHRINYEARDLHQYTPSDAQQFQNDTGSPVGFYIEHEQLHWVPTPDGAYTVYHVYWQNETALSDDTDEPNLPDRYIDWLIYTALVQVATRIRDNELHEIAVRERRFWEDRARTDLRRTSRTLVPKSRSDWSI